MINLPAGLRSWVRVIPGVGIRLEIEYGDHYVAALFTFEQWDALVAAVAEAREGKPS